MESQPPKKDFNLPTQDQKAQKIQEYENMFRILYKQKDYEKIKALAKELVEFDPKNKSAPQWIKKADKKLKPGFFASLFTRTKKTPKKNDSKASSLPSHFAPTIVAAPSTKALPTTLTSPVKDVPLLPMPKKEVVEPIAQQTTALPPLNPALAKTGSGYSFGKIFKKNQTPKTSSSATIGFAPKNEEKAPLTPIEKQNEIKPKKEFSLLGFAKLFMGFTVLFIFLTGAFLYLEFLDKDNKFLAWVGIEETTGSKLHAAAEELNQAKQKVQMLEQAFEKYNNGHQDQAWLQVQKITEERINWLDVLFKINEVTNSVYELNDFFNYVEYSDYSFDGEKQTIQISGQLSDPQGKNLTKLVELEEAFMFYPKDKNDPKDPTKPFFQGFKELKTLSKAIDQETGRYVSEFQLSFSLSSEH